VNYPADLVGKGWYLTVPVKDPVDGWAMEIEQPTLATYASRYFLLTDDHTGAVFRVWHGGATTSGSKNPRSELREQTPDGKAHAAWSCVSGRHRLVVRGRVNRLTKVRPHVVIGQIHSATDDVTVFRVEATSCGSPTGTTRTATCWTRTSRSVRTTRSGSTYPGAWSLSSTTARSCLTR
jgi:poly(beta-D-mannuronate) lyase